MRRKIVILTTTLALVVGIQCFASVYTRRVVGDTTALLTEMERAVDSEEWEQARSLMEPLSRAWHDSCEPLDWWISRVMIESAHSSLRNLAIALEVSDYQESRRLLAEFSDTLDEMTRWGELSLSNVV